LIDQDPFVVYKIDKVLMPRELFKGVKEDLAPAESPKPAKKKKTTTKKGKAPAADEDADSPADGPDADADSDDDKAADNNGVSGLNQGFRFVMVFFSIFIGFLVL
jgi:hypothetical protein